MRLNRVYIENFRSIKEATITFEPQCRVLVGKNEVGKTNILTALSMLDEARTHDKNDLRESLPTEDLIENGEINFVFTLEPKDKKEIQKSLLKTVLSLDKQYNFFKKDGKHISLEDFINDEVTEGLSFIEIPSGNRGDTYWSLNTKYEVNDYWKKPISGATFTVNVGGVQLPISNFKLINTNDYVDIPVTFLENVTPEYIHDDCIGTLVSQLVEKNKPNTLLWSYDDKYLLPSNIEISGFTSNPDICLPLKSMFELAGINNITEAINQATNKNRHGLKNLLERVAKLTTKHFRSVWSEYNNVEFVLSPNGTFIDAGVKDSFNSYDLSQRSDGFKRFVSFLLFISAKVKNNIMKNTLLLFDEPDLALHPSGQKYLREEMYKISNHNYIVYSTHSIFMIDKEQISRHLIVEKKDEVTNIKQVDESNFVDEEVIFNAMGFSVFETLKSNNIIFEGWKDKKVFALALSRVPEKYKEIKKLKQVGMCHAKGVKDVKHIANILELAGRDYIILSDNDNPAREKQDDFVDLRKSGSWKRYDELVEEIRISTVEDFIKPRCFVLAIDKLRGEYASLPLLNEESFNNTPKTKLLFLDEELSALIKDKGERKQMIENIKNEVFDNLKNNDIDEHYYMMISNLNKLMECEKNLSS